MTMETTRTLTEMEKELEHMRVELALRRKIDELQEMVRNPGIGVFTQTVKKSRKGGSHPPQPVFDTKTGVAYRTKSGAGKGVAREYGLPATNYVWYDVIRADNAERDKTRPSPEKDPTQPPRFTPMSMDEYHTLCGGSEPDSFQTTPTTTPTTVQATSPVTEAAPIAPPKEIIEVKAVLKEELKPSNLTVDPTIPPKIHKGQNQK